MWNEFILEWILIMNKRLCKVKEHLSRTNKNELFVGVKMWSPRTSVLFFGNHNVEEIAATCPAARLFLTCLVQLGEFPQRRLPVRHPSVWGPYALCFPGSEAHCRAALTDWLLKNGEQTYYDRLSRALQHIGRTDVAMGEYLIRGGNKHVLKSRVTKREPRVLMRCKLECGRSERCCPLRKTEKLDQQARHSGTRRWVCKSMCSFPLEEASAGPRQHWIIASLLPSLVLIGTFRRDIFCTLPVSGMRRSPVCAQLHSRVAMDRRRCKWSDRGLSGADTIHSTNHLLLSSNTDKKKSRQQEANEKINYQTRARACLCWVGLW